LDDYDKVLNKLAEGASGAVDLANGSNLTYDEKFKPKVVNPVEAAKSLKHCKRIAIMTGAGLSAASGIPTFRGAEGFWTNSYAGYKDPTIICTMKFFNENPEANWKWHFDFHDILKGKKPNAGHYAINNFVQWAKDSTNTETCLFTQNVDNFHPEAVGKDYLNERKSKVIGSSDYGFTKDIYEVHGNIAYMRCSNLAEDHAVKCYPTIRREEFEANGMPKCKECGSNMKIHAMFFDECYKESLY